MVVQPSKTSLVGYKSREVSWRESYLQRHGDHWQSFSADFPISSHFHLATCFHCDVWAARCVFDCLCLRGAVRGGGWGGVAAECRVVTPCCAASCL